MELTWFEEIFEEYYFKKSLPPPDKPEENSDSVFRN